MKTYHKNPRQITERQYKDLQRWLKELGDLSGIVHDLNSDEIIGGNQRGAIFDINNCEITIEDQHDPDFQGTVAQGYVIWQGAKYAYRQVRWNEKQCEMANIIANKAGGDWDFDILANKFNFEDLLNWGFDKTELIGFEDKMIDDKYSKRIEAPIYKPSGMKPMISELYDATRAGELILAIENSELPEHEKEFLKYAALRHVVFNYKKIAEYYAQSKPEVQALFEDSALIIIDFERAIELGYVKLSEQIIAQYKKDYGKE